jgi:hypothetical protein
MTYSKPGTTDCVSRCTRVAANKTNNAAKMYFQLSCVGWMDRTVSRVPDSSSNNAAITASFPPRLSAAVFTFEHIRKCQNFLLLFARAYMIHLGYMMYKLNILIVLVKNSIRKKVYRTIAFFPKGGYTQNNSIG